MDENTPPVPSVRGNHSNKNTVQGGSPVVNSVLKASTKDNISQSLVNRNIKAPVYPSPKVPALTVISSSETCPQEDSDDEIQFQPQSYTFDENADPFKSKGGLANSPIKPDKTKSISSPAQDKCKTDQDDSVLTSMIGSYNAEDPFKPSSQLQNSPEKDASGQPERAEKIKPLSGNLDDVNLKPDVQIPCSTADAQTATVNSLPENLDEIDPFKSNTKVVNSPMKLTSETVCDQDIDVSPSVEDTQVQKSPAEVSERAIGAGLPESLDDEDPFKPKSQIINSPPQNSTINSTLGTADLTVIENLPENFDEVDPFKPKSQIENSPAKETSGDLKEYASALPDNLDDIDPFKPKYQMQNSPVKRDCPDFIVAAETETTGLPENLDEIDPFQPKKQMQNSPVRQEPNYEGQVPDQPENLDDIDPFKPKSQMQNSPVKVATSETSQTKVTGLPENLDDIDPFKPKTQMQNSPVKPASGQNLEPKVTGLPDNLDDIDPFKPKTEMKNSPVKSTSDQNLEPKVAILPENIDDIDPFKPRRQIQNSPTKPVRLETTEAMVTELTESLDDIDPFKTKSQLPNSPNKSSGLGGKPAEVSGLPENLDDIDPFKPKSQLVNSPAVETETVSGIEDLDAIKDPFRTKTQIQNTPDKATAPENKSDAQTCLSDLDFDNLDPFKTKSTVANSPAKTLVPVTESADLSQVQNSPLKPNGEAATGNVGSACLLNVEGMDPFKSNVQTSPDGFLQMQLGMVNPVNKPVDNVRPVDPYDGLDAFNPFQGTMKSSNTPNKNNNALLQGLQNTPKMQGWSGLNLGNNLMCMIAPENKVEEDMNFTNEDFKPANEVFSDPNVWDMLEKFGNSSNNTAAESDLARMSLYVKFDPLVDSKPADSPGAQFQTGVAHGLQKMEVVRDGDESIMLMGTPPRGGGRRRSILVQRRPLTSVSKTIFEEESSEEKKPAKPHIVDLIFSCSPESENNAKEQEQKPQSSATLPDENKKDETFFEVVQVLKYSETDVKGKLEKQRQELMLEFQGRQLLMEQEQTKKQNVLDTQAKHYKEKADQLEIKNKEMRQVVVEYETFINELVSEKEKNTSESKEYKNKLKSERDQAIEDLQSVEKSFADLHRRYEKIKAVIEDYRKNEETLKKTNQDLFTKMQQQDEAMNKLRLQAESKFKQVCEEREKEKSSSSAEIIKLQAALKKSELYAAGLETTIQQKVKENEELTDLCDTLIAKVGGS